MAKSYKNRMNRRIKTNKRKTNKRNTNKRNTKKCKTKRKMQNRRYKGGATTIDYIGILKGSVPNLDEASFALSKQAVKITIASIEKKSYDRLLTLKKEINLITNSNNPQEIINQLKLVVATLKEASGLITNDNYKKNALNAANNIEQNAQLLSSEPPPIESPPSELPSSDPPPSTNTIPA